MPSSPITTPSQRHVRGAVSQEDNRYSLPIQTETAAQEPEGWTLVTSKGYRSEHNTLHPSRKLFQKTDLAHDYKRKSFEGREKQTPNSPFNSKLSTNTYPGLDWSSSAAPSNAEDSGRLKTSRLKSQMATKIQESFSDRYTPPSSSFAKSSLSSQSVIPCSQWSAGNGRVESDEAGPISQWKCLENISPLKMFQSLKVDSSTTLTSKTQSGPHPNITTKVSNSGYNTSPQVTNENLPKGVVRLCKHFLQDQKAYSQPAYCCFNCGKNSKFEYGIWRSVKRKWQVMRPRPKDVHFAVQFEICWHYSNGSECRPNCTFAHGEEEQALWTTQRQEGRYDLEEVRLCHAM